MTGQPPAVGGATPDALVAAVRAAGVGVAADAVVLLTRALGELEPLDAASLYWAARVTLVAHRDDLDAFDRGFVAFVAGSAATPDPSPSAAAEDRPVEARAEVVGDDRPAEAEGEDGDDLPVLVAASREERLAERDFARCTPAELAELARAVDRLRWTGATRRSRRLTAGGSTRDRLDLRRTTAAALATDGELLVRHHRSRASRPRRLVLLADVSGSMEPHARMLLRLGHAAVVSRRHTEVFTLGTRLTRVTPALARRDPDRALDEAAASVEDWSGGTRLADGMAELLARWGRRGLARGADVVVLSDGWERGDPAELGEQMRRLALLAHRVVWVNPLRATPGYAPLAGGMAAALPHVDEFVDGHSLRSFEELVDLLAR
jgi:uncharacterized protein with von Willebrand factor type A (vWA) domain